MAFSPWPSPTGVQAGAAVFADINDKLGFGVEGSWGTMTQNSGPSVQGFGAGAVLRQAFANRDATHLFAQVRVGWTGLSSGDATQSGIAMGPELGVEVPVSPVLRLMVAGGAQWRHYGDARLFLGPTLAGSSGSAWRYGIRVGVGTGATP